MTAYEEMPPEFQSAIAAAFRYVRQHLDGDPAVWAPPAEVEWLMLPGLAYAMIGMLRELARRDGQDETEFARKFLDDQIEDLRWGALEADVIRPDA